VAAIRASSLAKQFETAGGPLEALRDVTLTVPEGEFCCLVGPSGCGKTTFLRILAGLETPSGGALEIHAPDPGRPATAVIFQDTSIFPWMTVLENAAFGLEARGVPREEREQRALPMLRKVGLGQFTAAYPHQLSGGMKQRVSIARGLVQDPAVLLMDEPFASLDEQTRMLLGDELLRIWSETRKTVLFVTHSLNEAVYLADRVIVLSARPGRLVDDVAVDLPRPRSFAMTSTERFGALKDRVWQHIRTAERL